MTLGTIANYHGGNCKLQRGHWGLPWGPLKITMRPIANSEVQITAGQLPPTTQCQVPLGPIANHNGPHCTLQLQPLEFTMTPTEIFNGCSRKLQIKSTAIYNGHPVHVQWASL